MRTEDQRERRLHALAACGALIDADFFHRIAAIRCEVLGWDARMIIAISPRVIGYDSQRGEMRDAREVERWNEDMRAAAKFLTGVRRLASAPRSSGGDD